MNRRVREPYARWCERLSLLVSASGAVYSMCALHEQSTPAAKQQKKIQKYNYFWLKQSFEQVFFFQRVQVPYTPWKKWEVLVRRKVVYREVCTEGSDTAKFGTDE